MKKTRLFKTLTSAALTAAMVLSMGGMTAFADTQDLTFTKKITKPANVYTPAVGTIGFTVTPEIVDTDGKKEETWTVVENGSDVEKTYTIFNGKTGGLYLDTGAAFTVNDDDLSKTEVSATVTLKIDKAVLTNPGIYRYSVQESDHNYEGLSKDNTKYYVDVYVSKESGVMTYNTVVWYENEQGEIAKMSEITNDYTPNDLTVTKVITGNQGDEEDTFNFKITVEGAKGEYFTVTDTSGNLVTDTEGNPVVLTYDRTGTATDKGTVTVTLGHNESIMIKGLSNTDKFTVEELDANTDGYSTKYKLDDGDNQDNKIENQEEGTTSRTVTVTNDRTVSTPTGIALSFAPYILMVALAGVFAVLFLRKRREEF